MRDLIKQIKAAIFVLFLLTSTGSKAQIIDQFDTNYTAGISARTLPGYSWYQTFTAGITGTLTRLDIGFFNYISGMGTLEVYEDTGITGNMIYSSQVNVVCPGNSCLLPFLVNCNVIAGNRYTFHFIPGTGIPDPYGVQADFMNSYTGGEMFLIDPNGTYPFNMDVVFVTYVNQKTTNLNDEVIDTSTLFKIIGSSIVLAENVTGDIYSLNGQRVPMVALQPGVYLLKIFFKNFNFNYKIHIQ